MLVEQVQQGEPYTFWLRLRAGPPGQRTDHRVRIDGARQRVPIEGPLEALEVDPDVELLYRAAR